MEMCFIAEIMQVIIIRIRYDNISKLLLFYFSSSVRSFSIVCILFNETNALRPWSHMIQISID